MEERVTALEAESVQLLIVDIDNTLYDWIGYFVPAFDSMTREAASILQMSQDDLRLDLKHIHQLRGNTEHPIALLETNSENERGPSLTPD